MRKKTDFHKILNLDQTKLYRMLQTLQNLNYSFEYYVLKFF